MPETEAFDKHTDRYDRWFENHPYAYQSELLAVRSLLPEPGLAVEIGVGTGRFASELGVHYGIEPSVPMAKYARDRGIEVALGVAESLPLKSGCLIPH